MKKRGFNKSVFFFALIAIVFVLIFSVRASAQQSTTIIRHFREYLYSGTFKDSTMVKYGELSFHNISDDSLNKVLGYPNVCVSDCSWQNLKHVVSYYLVHRWKWVDGHKTLTIFIVRYVFKDGNPIPALYYWAEFPILVQPTEIRRK